MLIGVIVSANQEITAIEKGKFINIYCQRKGIWLHQKSIPLRLDFSSMSSTRDSIRATIEKLGECKVIAGQSVSGLPYNVFDRMGFAIFEVENFSFALLDRIKEDIENAEQALAAKEEVTLTPVETDSPGHYYLNLIKLQETYPEVSSKRALRDFLRQPFVELTLVCSHIPPWLEIVDTIKYQSRKNQVGEIEVTIYKEC